MLHTVANGSTSPCPISICYFTTFLITVNWPPAHARAGFLASWSSTITGPLRPTSAPPTCFPPGWTGAAPPSSMRSCASISTRGSCCPGRCASTWTCKGPTELTPCCRLLLHPCSLLKVWSWEAVVLLLTVEKTAALPTRASDRFTNFRLQCCLKECRFY